jgi:chloride channel protein, CIC family
MNDGDQIGHFGSMVTHSAKIAETKGSLLALAFLALVVGAAAGLVGAIFHLALAHADRLRDLLIGWAHGQAAAGILLAVVTCGVATSIAAWMVRRFSPQASGSGIPHVEAVVREQVPPAPYGLAPVKFLGGLLAIGSGPRARPRGSERPDGGEPGVLHWTCLWSRLA